MEKPILWIILTNFLCFLAFGQSPELPARFELADVHISAKTVNPFVRTGPARGGRYEVKNATMVDLIRIAYGSVRTRCWADRTGLRWIGSTCLPRFLLIRHRKRRS
jgi:hypothetical protein